MSSLAKGTDRSLLFVKVHWLIETPSTNILALDALEDGAVFVADTQTAGRGQHGRRWESAPGLGLWFSICLKGNPTGLNFAAPLAIRQALAPLVPVNIKWPNDVLLDGRKLCGILIEHRGGWNALGIGLNVNHIEEDFPPELRGQATSLRMATGTEQDRRQVLDAILASLDPMLESWRSGRLDAIHRAWSEACGIIGQPVHRAGIVGTAESIREDGALLVRTDTGLVTLTAWPDMDTGS